MFNWGARKERETAPRPAAAPAPAETLAVSKVLPKFLSALATRPTPLLVDLGPVVGANVEFFGDRLACKIHVLDLFTEVEAAARTGVREGLADRLAERLTLPYDSVDGILCWDLFDFLDRATSQSLAQHLSRLLRPGGALYAFFGTTPAELRSHARFVVAGDDSYKVRSVPASPTTRAVLANRDISRMFDGLTTAESVLLKSNTRETLFRKPQTTG